MRVEDFNLLRPEVADFHVDAVHNTHTFSLKANLEIPYRHDISGLLTFMRRCAGIRLAGMTTNLFGEEYHIQTDKISRAVADDPNSILIVDPESLSTWMDDDGMLGVFLYLEGVGGFIDSDEIIDYLIQNKICGFSLTWVKSNKFASSQRENRTHPSKGLTDLGRRLIAAVNKTYRNRRIKLFVDITHASKKTALDIIDLLDPDIPLIASHANAKAVWPQDDLNASGLQNLDDEVLFLLAQRPHTQVSLFSWRGAISSPERYLNENDLDLLYEHFLHMLEILGEDKLSFSTDPDPRIEHRTQFMIANGVYNLGIGREFVRYLISKGHSREQVYKFAMGNSLNILKALFS